MSKGTNDIAYIQGLIEHLEQKRQNIEEQIIHAKALLNSLLNDNKDATTSLSDNVSPLENKKLPYSTIAKMRVAQQERQKREQRFKLQKIQNFLQNQGSATTQEVSEHMKLSQYVVKKYMRSENSHCDEYQPDTWKFID